MPTASCPDGFRLGGTMRRAKGVADPADPGEIKLALKIAAAGQDLRRHGIEHCFEADAIAGIELVAGMRNVHPQAVRLVGWVEPWQRIIVDDDPPSLLHHIDVDDPSGYGNRSKVALKHRRLALPGGFPHQRKARGKHGECEDRLTPP